MPEREQSYRSVTEYRSAFFPKARRGTDQHDHSTARDAANLAEQLREAIEGEFGRRSRSREVEDEAATQRG